MLKEIYDSQIPINLDINTNENRVNQEVNSMLNDSNIDFVLRRYSNKVVLWELKVLKKSLILILLTNKLIEDVLYTNEVYLIPKNIRSQLMDKSYYRKIRESRGGTATFILSDEDNAFDRTALVSMARQFARYYGGNVWLGEGRYRYEKQEDSNPLSMLEEVLLT